MIQSIELDRLRAEIEFEDRSPRPVGAETPRNIARDSRHGIAVTFALAAPSIRDGNRHDEE